MGTSVAPLNYFFVEGDGRPTTSFGLGNWTGLIPLTIVIALLLPTDRALRELKTRRWKNLQRLNYTLFALVVAHAFFYGALLRMTSPYTILLLVIVFTVLLGQRAGQLAVAAPRPPRPTAGHVKRERQLNDLGKSGRGDQRPAVTGGCGSATARP